MQYESELIDLGNDESRTLAVRLRSLGKVTQTDVDPWPPGLIGGYLKILEDPKVDVVKRIEIAYGLTAYSDPVRNIRHNLLRGA